MTSMTKTQKKIVLTTVILSLFSSFLTFSSSNNRLPLSAAPASGASYYTDAERYYEGIDDSLTGENLITALSTLTSTDFVSKSYASLPSIYQYSDVSETDPNKMRLVYTGTEKPFSAGSIPSSTNKEHVWPASWYGDGNRNEGAGTPGADAHNIWPSATELNSKRGTSAFDELDFATSFKAYEMTRSDWSYGTPGDNDSYVWSTAFNFSNGQNNDVLYPARGHRGEIARTLMYVATRYRNDNRFPVMLHDNPTTLKTGRIGKLSTLLKWHFQEPPTSWEIKRNNEIASRWHHNRNPFIDDPSYASRIYYYLPEPGQTSPTAAVKEAIETYATNNERIIVDKTNITLEVGQSLLVNITENPLNEEITWSSNNEEIVTVSNGLVNAVSPGVTKVIAEAATSSVEINVKVVPVGGEVFYIDDLSFSPNSATISVGEGKTLVPNISPSNATNTILTWSSSNHQVATVNTNGDVVGLKAGSATITASTTDGTNLHASVNITVREATSEASGGFYRVNDVSTLAAGDKIVFASSENGATAGYLSSNVLGKVASTFSSDKSKIETLGVETNIFTLGGDSSGWTFESTDGNKLQDSGEKKLALNTTGTTTWVITIANNFATIIASNKEYSLQYNSQYPRFTTYKSAQVKPEIYRQVNETNDLQEEVFTYITSFMYLTGIECSNHNVLLSTWQSLSNDYASLSSAAKEYIYEHLEEDTFIDAFIDRYLVIINGYDYDNFLARSDGSLIVMKAETRTMNVSTHHFNFLPLLIGITLISLSYTFIKKSKK